MIGKIGKLKKMIEEKEKEVMKKVEKELKKEGYENEEIQNIIYIVTGGKYGRRISKNRK